MRKHAGSIVKFVILAVVSCCILVPILFMISTSLKESGDVFRYPFQWISDVVCWDNYVNVIKEHRLQDYLLNSLFVAVIATCINLFLSSMAGFSLSKYKYRGQKLMLTAIIGLLLLPTQVLIVPLFMLISKIGLTDNLWAIILPYMTSPFAIFLMRQYFVSIPDETIEAARIDGASEWQIYWRIALPQAKPALGALGIFSFMFHWNNFTWPLIALNDHANFTLPLGIAMMPGEYQTPYNELMAAATLASIPILIIYFILQNYFISGMVIRSSIGKENT